MGTRNRLFVTCAAFIVSACALVPRGGAPAVSADQQVLGDERMTSVGFRVMSDPADPSKPRTFGRIQRVYVNGSGPKVILLHELPGLRHGDIEVARALSDTFEVYTPLLFGFAGQDDTRLGHRQACKSGLFRCNDRNTRHPIMVDLSAMAAEICGGAECGIIGMCLTGTLPLYLMPVEGVVALVIAQPTLPLVWHVWPLSGLDISEEDTRTAMELAAKREASVYMVRYRHDVISGRSAFKRLVKRIEPWKEKLSFFEVTEIQARGHSSLVADSDPPEVAKAQIQAVVKSLNARLRRASSDAIWRGTGTSKTGRRSRSTPSLN